MRSHELGVEVKDYTRIAKLSHPLQKAGGAIGQRC